jgi:secondary thiamine-phosphate synthase enzyme
LAEHEGHVRHAVPTWQLIEPTLEATELETAHGNPGGRGAAVGARRVGSWHRRGDDRIVRRKLSSYQEVVEIRTPGRGFTNVTQQVQAAVGRSGAKTALCTVFVQHTSASLVIQENADPNVLRDLGAWLADLAPEARPWVHDDEGPDDMPAHVRAILTGCSLAIPVHAGKPMLGTWQGIYLYEHRTHAHQRKVTVTVLGH